MEPQTPPSPHPGVLIRIAVLLLVAAGAVGALLALGNSRLPLLLQEILLAIVALVFLVTLAWVIADDPKPTAAPNDEGKQ